MAGKKRVDPIKQREKRAKIAAGIGAVLFLAIAAFEVPKMMKLMHPNPVVPPPTAVAAPDGTVTTQTTTTPTGVTASGELADTDVPPADEAGQLVAFDVFETKDPFRPQVTAAAPTTGTSTTPASTTPTSTTPTATTPATTTPAPTTPVSAVPSTPPPGTPAETTPTSTTPSVPARPLVSISVNGAVSHVSTGGTFPSGTPVFRLVSWTKSEARIGIVGGSYATGDQTLPLALGKAVTLQNTSDGKQYKLVLVATP